jgi:uncharacterized membrane protein
MENTIETLEELRKKFKPLLSPNELHKKQHTNLENLAVYVTDRIGTMGFFFIILIWTVLWLGWNMLAPTELRFDPFPGFVLWLFISNLIQIHLMPLIMIGQNIQGKHAEIRTEHDYQTDKKAEHEIETILLHLENQQKLILEVLKKIEHLEEKQALSNQNS